MRKALIGFFLLNCFGQAADTVEGMNRQKLAEIPVRMKEFVDAGTISGIVTILARHGKVVEFDAVGWRDLESHAPMQKDSLFRIASRCV